MTPFHEPDLEGCLSSLPALQPSPEFQKGYRIDKRSSRVPVATRRTHWILLTFVPTALILIMTAAFLCAHPTVLSSAPHFLPHELRARFQNTRWPASVISLPPGGGTVQLEESCEKAINSGETALQIYTTLDNLLGHDPCLRKTTARVSKTPETLMNDPSIANDRILPFEDEENKVTFGIGLFDGDVHLRRKFRYAPPQYQANPSQPANMEWARHLEFYSKSPAALGSPQTTTEHANQAPPHRHRHYKRHLSAGVWVGVSLGSFLIFIMIIMAYWG